jgi:hypothetical protein
MATKLREILDFIVKNSPKKIGVKGIYYKIDGDVLMIKFVVEKKNASILANYLNSLSTVIKKAEGIQIESSVYVYEGSNTAKTAKEMNFSELDLVKNFSLNLSCA